MRLAKVAIERFGVIVLFLELRKGNYVELNIKSNRARDEVRMPPD
jgi:hypothetical protein